MADPLGHGPPPSGAGHPLPPALLAVLGHPVAHSLSPAMHEAAFAAAGREGRYVACDVPAERLPRALDGLAALGFLGCNCTVPLKERACALATRRSPEAALTGSANTLAFRPGGEIYADTTDGRGLLMSLRHEAGWTPAGRRVLLLGAGGAARAVAAALVRAGAAGVAVANRTPERARRLAADLGGAVEAAASVPECCRAADLIINCTTVGMDGHSLPLGREALEAIPPGALVCDIVYAPREDTPLLRAARVRGLRTVGGLGMLAWQAALAWEVWFGAPGPAEVFLATARGVLAARGCASGSRATSFRREMTE